MFKKSKSEYHKLSDLSQNVIESVIDPAQYKKLMGVSATKLREVSSNSLIEHRKFTKMLHDNIEFWISRGARVIYPDLNYSTFVKETDAISKIAPCDLKVTFPAFFIFIPKNLGIESGIRGFLNGLLITFQDGFISVTTFWENGPATCHYFDQQLDMYLRGTVSVDFNMETWVLEDATNAAFNYMLLMQETPEYIEKQKSRKIHTSNKEFSSKEYNFSYGAELKLQQRVMSDSSHKNEPSSGIWRHYNYDKSWRKAYWRRQPHGNSWASENSDWPGTIGTFKDGRSYHLIHLPFTTIHYKTSD